MILVKTDNIIASDEANFFAYKNNFLKFCGYAIDNKLDALERRDKENILIYVKKVKNKAAEYLAILTLNRKITNYSFVNRTFLNNNLQRALNILKTSDICDSVNVEDKDTYVKKCKQKASEYFNNVFLKNTLYAASIELDDNDNHVVSRIEFDFLK